MVACSIPGQVVRYKVPTPGKHLGLYLHTSLLISTNWYLRKLGSKQAHLDTSVRCAWCCSGGTENAGLVSVEHRTNGLWPIDDFTFSQTIWSTNAGSVGVRVNFF